MKLRLANDFTVTLGWFDLTTFLCAAYVGYANGKGDYSPTLDDILLYGPAIARTAGKSMLTSFVKHVLPPLMVTARRKQDEGAFTIHYHGRDVKLSSLSDEERLELRAKYDRGVAKIQEDAAKLSVPGVFIRTGAITGIEATAGYYFGKGLAQLL